MPIRHAPRTRTRKGAFAFSRFKPKNDLFYDLFSSSAHTLATATKVLAELFDPEADIAAIATRMVELEHECDRITDEPFRTLNSSFVTPFDRSDIYLLGSSLDDVMDHMEAATHLATLYRVPRIPPHLCDVIGVLDNCAKVTSDAMPRLATMKNLEPYWIEMNALENRADQMYRSFLAELFDGNVDALTVMKLKDIADELEDAADAFERVSHVVESIVLKES
ncbi:DUF47 family protein [Rhodococcus sp. HNM0569]|uniref:DUF47 domain-containing protein n=1 Tax=Rhodococcus sp. HNM0569 TaxID=2716340 RepID=UPI0023F7440E|nr:DUF47 family protein [Rhodococcus sp. HNM0569]